MKFFSILLIYNMFFTPSFAFLFNSYPSPYYQPRLYQPQHPPRYYQPQYYQPRYYQPPHYPRYYQPQPQQDKTQQVPVRLDNLIQSKETSNKYESNQYYLEKDINIPKNQEDNVIDDEDILNVSDKKYYDKYSFKINWADNWKESNIKPTGWFEHS